MPGSPGQLRAQLAQLDSAVVQAAEQARRAGDGLLRLQPPSPAALQVQLDLVTAALARGETAAAAETLIQAKWAHSLSGQPGSPEEGRLPGGVPCMGEEEPAIGLPPARRSQVESLAAVEAGVLARLQRMIETDRHPELQQAHQLLCR